MEDVDGAELHEKGGTNENEKLKRDLTSRHLQMIAIGGSIGTGLFVGSGNNSYTTCAFSYLLILHFSDILEILRNI
jgi:amino acid permease